jgi:hypothetical protein
VLHLRNVTLETLQWSLTGLTACERADVVLMDAVPEDFGVSLLH